MSTQKNEQPTQHEIADANRHTGESCGEVSGGFICTRTPGHTGLHVASNGTEGVKSWPITPPTDTTGSGREGETAERDEVLWQSFLKAFIAEFPSKPIYDTDSCRSYVRFAAIFAECRLAAAIAQVEALRREKALLPADWMQDSSLETWFPLSAQTLKERQEDAKLLAWMNRERLTVTWNPHHGAFIVQRYDQVCGNIGVGKTVIEALRAAIDSAQRQEGR